MKPTKTASAAGLRRELDRCVACGKCRALCPVFSVEGSEASVARGKLKILAAAEDGELDYDTDLGRLLDDCLGCRLCTSGCPQGVRTDELVYAARQRIRDRRSRNPLELFILRYLLPRRGLLASLARFVGRWQHRLARLLGRSRDASPHDGLHVQRALAGLYRRLLPLAGLSPRLVPPTLSPRQFSSGRGEVQAFGDVNAERWGYFVGCALETAYPRSARAVVELARRLGITLIAPTTQACCGLPAWGSGDRRAASALINVNAAAFADRDLDGVVTACASCASFLREHYTGPLGRTLTLQELLRGRLDRLKLRRTPGLRVTWHQPCHLARHLDVELAEPLLSRLADFVELEERDVCCGGAGSYFIKHPETAAAIGERKAKHIVDSGAEVVVTACPGCAMQLEASLTRLDAPVRVVLLGDFLARRLPPVSS